MIKIEKVLLEDLEIIHQLAVEIWWPTYQKVLSEDQISFMLSKMYSLSALKIQLEEGYIFLMLYANDIPKGFACYSKTNIDKTYKLQKLYLHPDQQGKGTGKLLLSRVEKEAKAEGATTLILNVHRKNKAKHFYEKVGYQVIEEIDIPFFHFTLNDYIMSKDLG